MNITYLGPKGATFSEAAYLALEDLISNLPPLEKAKLHFARSNEEVIPLLLKHGGFGILPLATQCFGKIDVSMKSLSSLLERNGDISSTDIIAMARMRVNFALMARPNVGLIRRVLGHQQSLNACHGRIKESNLIAVSCPSNGAAIEEVTYSSNGSGNAALGPLTAAEAYGLKVFEKEFEDGPSETFFALLGPAQERLVSNESQAIMLFTVRDASDDLHGVLDKFRGAGINLSFVEKDPAIKGRCACILHAKLSNENTAVFSKAAEAAKEKTLRSLILGPFPVFAC